MAGLGTGAASAAADEIQWHFAGGVSLPQGDADNALNGGWTMSGGATWFPWDSNLGIQFEGAVDWWDAKSSFLEQIDTDPDELGTQAPDDGDARVWAFRTNLLWDIANEGPVGFYVKAGVGLYYGQFELGEYGYVPYYWCDWWWGYCYPTVGTGEYILGEESSTELGWNAGAGITFRTSGEGRVFVEATYQYMDTANGAEWVPISIGYRW